MKAKSESGYRVYAAMAEDASSGWVHIAPPETKKKRSVVKLRHGKRSVYCEAIDIDANFRARYERSPHRLPLTGDRVLVMNGWYRDRLGITQARGKEYDIEITVHNRMGHIHAARHNPQLVVRLATRLALIAIVLGVIAVVLGVIAA